MTYDEVEAKKNKAERFVRNVLQDDDRADEIADESVWSYADRKHLVINPGRINTMANASQSKQDLLDEIADLQDENDSLQAQLDAISCQELTATMTAMTISTAMTFRTTSRMTTD